MNFSSGELDSLMFVHPEGGKAKIYMGGPVCVQAQSLKCSLELASLMSVYACSQEVVITGDGGVTLGNTVSRCRKRWREMQMSSSLVRAEPPGR